MVELNKIKTVKFYGFDFRKKVTKRGKPVLVGKIRERLKQIIEEIYNEN